MSIKVSKHAIDRYIERIAPVTRQQAFDAIHSHRKALEIADQIGGATVRCADGSRLVVSAGYVKTVIGADCRFNHPRKST